MVTPWLLGYQPSIVRFVTSLGATISMDGTAMYYSPVVLWLADCAGVHVDAGTVVVLSVIATLTSMGAAPTPGGGPALVMIIWASVFPNDDLPPQFAYYLAIDWLVDRFRTCCNILGDSFVTGIVDAVTKRSAAGAAVRASCNRDSSLADGLTLRALSQTSVGLSHQGSVTSVTAS